MDDDEYIVENQNSFVFFWASATLCLHNVEDNIIEMCGFGFNFLRLIHDTKKVISSKQTFYI